MLQKNSFPLTLVGRRSLLYEIAEHLAQPGTAGVQPGTAGVEPGTAGEEPGTAGVELGTAGV